LAISNACIGVIIPRSDVADDVEDIEDNVGGGDLSSTSRLGPDSSSRVLLTKNGHVPPDDDDIPDTIFIVAVPYSFS